MGLILISHAPADKIVAASVKRRLIEVGISDLRIRCEGENSGAIREADVILLIATDAGLADAERLALVRMASGFAQSVLIALGPNIAPDDARLRYIPHELPLALDDPSIIERIRNRLEGVDLDYETTTLFICYSRYESDSVSELTQALRARGIRAFQDISNLDPGGDWRNQLMTFIDEADGFVFMMSSASLKSPHCLAELNRATETAKRILPVIVAPIDSDTRKSAPEALRSRNFVNAADRAEWPRALAEIEAWATRDAAWYQAHATLVRSARAWLGAGKPPDRLLRGDVRVAARTTVTQAPRGAPATPTETLEFLAASEAQEQSERNARRRLVQRGFVGPVRRAIELGLYDRAMRLAAAGALLSEDPQLTLEAEVEEPNRSALWRAAARAVLGPCRAILRAPIEDGTVVDAAFAQGSSSVVTLFSSGGAAVWPETDGAPLRRFAIEQHNVEGSVCPDGRLVAIVTGASIAVLEATTGELIADVPKPSAADTTAFAWSVTGCLATAHADGVVAICDLNRKASTLRIGAGDFRKNALTWSPNGALLAIGSANGDVRVWDAGANTVTSLRGHQKAVRCCRWRPDGRALLTASHDGTAAIWHQDEHEPRVELGGHRGAVLDASWRPDGNALATASRDGLARIWSAAGVELQTLAGHQGWVRVLSWSRDGGRLLTGAADGDSRLWDPLTGECIATLRGHDEAVLSCQFNFGGDRILTRSEDGDVRVWDAAVSFETSVLRGHRGWVRDWAWRPDAKAAISVADDGNVYSWPMASNSTTRSGSLLAAVEEPSRACTWSPAGDIIAVGTEDGATKLWRVPAAIDGVLAQPVATLQGHRQAVLCCAFSADGARLATASKDGTTTLWDVAGRNPRVVLRDPAAEVRSCAWSPDGTLVATASNDQTARIWRSDNGHVVCELSNHSDWVRDCAFNAQGDRLATAADDRTARLWSISGRELLVMEHSGAVRKCAFHPKLDLLATVSRDGFIRVWEVHSGAEIFAVKGHDQPIESCAWAPDGTRLATASRDSTVRIWDMSRVIAHRGDPAIRLLAGLGCGLGKLSRSERNDLLLQQAPHDLHEALTQALAGSRTSEVDTPDLAELVRRFRAEATVMGAALRAPLNALCQLAPSQRDPGRALHATGNHTPRSRARTGRIRTVLGWVAAALAVAAAFLLGRASR